MGDGRAQRFRAARLFAHPAGAHDRYVGADVSGAAAVAAVFGAGGDLVRWACLARHEHLASADTAGLRSSTSDSATVAADRAFLPRGDRRLCGAVLARAWRVLEGPSAGARHRRQLM